MKANEIRENFLSFFKLKDHRIISSAPMVIKNDPTLMFTNAGMNQFKDVFLGNQPATYKRIADAQKCLRVSGKHNDLEEVGLDTYHHTMFEMLGNWSFGDYFKKEAIEWAWEFLTKCMGIPEERIYATVFEGDPGENIPRDEEAANYWEKCLPDPDTHLIDGSKKDNFWEMGETGPCGPCSEIHVDIRPENERKAKPGHLQVNKGDPQVIEIWNLVFIQYNRKAGGKLEQLPEKHVDTGMGFERLCMVIQNKKSNYDTDIFQPIISLTARITGKPYGERKEWDIAHRVIADHLRAVAFSVADGQLPSNNKAGYVIRRILRRAVRYGYTSLGMNEPFIYKLLPSLIESMGSQYPELKAQQKTISKVIFEEEQSFLKTLEKGLKMIERKTEALANKGISVFPGSDAFELFDTYGFPVDLTQLILREKGMTLDEKAFNKELNAQKERSRDDAAVTAGDWVVIHDAEKTLFTGYDRTEDTIMISRYRKVNSKGREIVHLVFNHTPFYAESGGQTGDKGYIESNGERIMITDTIKENNLIIHIADKVPVTLSTTFRAVVDKTAREDTAGNHSATHLLHYALRKVLGTHVEQKGSLVAPDRLRFDFSHFKQLTAEELAEVENIVNEMIMENIVSDIRTDIPYNEAIAMGAMALFGEKYGEKVRVVSFGNSTELCGGTHVKSTANIGLFKIISEGAVAAGVRRIEAVTGRHAISYVNNKLKTLDEITLMLKSTGNPVVNISKLMAENSSLRNTIEKIQQAAVSAARKKLKEKAVSEGICRIYSGIPENMTADMLKNLVQQIRQSDNTSVIIIGSENEGKVALAAGVGDQALKSGLNAVNIIKTVSKLIEGGGGGQPFLATAGGKKAEGLREAVSKAVIFAKSIIQNN